MEHVSLDVLSRQSPGPTLPPPGPHPAALLYPSHRAPPSCNPPSSGQVLISLRIPPPISPPIPPRVVATPHQPYTEEVAAMRPNNTNHRISPLRLSRNHDPTQNPRDRPPSRSRAPSNIPPPIPPHLPTQINPSCRASSTTTQASRLGMRSQSASSEPTRPKSSKQWLSQSLPVSDHFVTTWDETDKDSVPMCP